MVEHLVQSLEADPPSHLTPNELAHLLVLIQTTLEVSLLLLCMFMSPDVTLAIQSRLMSNGEHLTQTDYDI
jgi:hypothetical protein